MDNDNILLGLTAAALAAVGAYFRQLSFPLALLAVVMCCDYASGLLRAWEKGTLSSKVGIRGIIKKVAYLFAVAVAVAADMVVQIAAERAGMALDGEYFCALLVTVWLILNECISILENISDIGVPVPEFLGKLIGKLKKTAEEKGGAGRDERGEDP